jgi:hypothetical protein
MVGRALSRVRRPGQWRHRRAGIGVGNGLCGASRSLGSTGTLARAEGKKPLKGKRDHSAFGGAGVESFCSEWEGERLRLCRRQAPKTHHHFHSTALISSSLESDTILSAFIRRPGSGHLVVGLALGRSLEWSRGQIAAECCCGVWKVYIAVFRKQKRN